MTLRLRRQRAAQTTHDIICEAVGFGLVGVCRRGRVYRDMGKVAVGFERRRLGGYRASLAIETARPGGWPRFACRDLRRDLRCSLRLPGIKNGQGPLTSLTWPEDRIKRASPVAPDIPFALAGHGFRTPFLSVTVARRGAAML